MISGLLLLPPSSVHADSGMHLDGQASHHSADHSAGMAIKDLPDATSAFPMQGDDASDYESDPCCGGICLTAALCAHSDSSVTSAQTTRYSPISKFLVSADPRGQLRPPRA